MSIIERIQLSEMEFLLMEAAAAVQLTATQYESAVAHYRALSNWLSADGSSLAQYEIDMFPQGSMALGTTVKPLAANEFDLDFVCLVRGATLSAETLYALVHNRIVENGLYAGKVTKKKRCVSLNYADDFHVDIIPAIPAPGASSPGDTNLLIPDRALADWTHSNPKGFIQWFKSRSLVLVRKGLRADANVEPLPKIEKVDEKFPLAVAVQLIKRLRDRLFRDDADAPRSIVLTTLAGLGYHGEDSIVSAMLDTASAIDAFVDSSVRRLVNPANPNENFADKIDQLQVEKLRKLANWVRVAVAEMRETVGIEAWKEVLSRYFGERPATAALERFGEVLKTRRDTGTLTASAAGLGVVNSTGIRVPKNNYFGSR